MATTAKGIVPDPKAKGQKARKPMSKQLKARLVAGLKEWRDGLSEEERANLAERTRQTHKERWANLTERQRHDRLAGVRAWQKEQRSKKRAAAKAKPAPKVDPKKAPRKAAKRTEVSEGAVEIEVIGPNGTSKPSKGNNVLAAPKRTRKAVAK